MFEKNEDSDWSQDVVVDLKGLFTPFEITGIQETVLGGNQWLKHNDRLEFGVEGVKGKRAVIVEAFNDDFKVSLSPMQIRTFVIDIKKTF